MQFMGICFSSRASWIKPSWHWRRLSRHRCVLALQEVGFCTILPAHLPAKETRISAGLIYLRLNHMGA